MAGFLGLLLIWVAAIYLALTHPFVPGWLWGALFAALLFALSRQSRVAGLLESAVVLLGWAVGAALADATGLFSLKLVGVGAALWAYGAQSERSTFSYLGAGLVLAGALVGLFEVGAAPWVAFLALAVGVYLLLRGGRFSPSAEEEPEFEERYRRLLRWRLEEARRLGKRVDEVLPDELVPRLARAKDRSEIEEILGPERAEKVEELAALLLEAQRVP